MITVRDLAEKLVAYCGSGADHGKHEIMLQFDGDVAYPFERGETNQAIGGLGTVEKFLVLVPDTGGKKLVLRGMG